MPRHPLSEIPIRRVAGFIAVAVLLTMSQAQSPSGAQKTLTFTSNTSVVLVNLTVRDAKGNLVTNLQPADVTLSEDGKKQTITSFQLENVDHPAPLPPVNAPAGTLETAAPPAAAGRPALPKPAVNAIAAQSYRDRRLIVLYFDLTTMQPEDVASVVEQAERYVRQQMAPADLASIVTLGNSLNVAQDFTADKTALLHTLDGLNPATSTGFVAGSTGATEGTADNGDTFTADDTDFNLANADRSLEAMQSMCDMLAPIQQKKSVVYFSSGIQRSGIDNEITLRSAVNACVRANAAIYSVDARGLQALPPGGTVENGSIRGQSAFNGGAQSSAFDNEFAQQETISTLATDTGGRAFLDTNNFGPVYTAVQRDTRSYYLIGYSSTNHAQDGKYRKIKVVVSRPGVTIDARPGYYAVRDLAHMDRASREQQLQDELNANVTDKALSLYLADGYLRLDENRDYVPVSIVIPGREIPLHGLDPKATPEVDIAGEVIDQAGRLLSHVRETIKLTPQLAGSGQELQNRNLQYNTGFLLAPGQKYQIRFAARENQTGQMGAFETVLSIPNLEATAKADPHALSLSSILVGSQLEKVRPDRRNPLSASGQALVMNVNHVFTRAQTMYLYFEVYDPRAKDSKAGLRLLTNVAFFHGGVKVYESQQLVTERVTDPDRQAAVIQVQVPLSQLQPGYYICQVNAVDASTGRFAFPRIPVLVRPQAGPVSAGTAAAARPET